MIEIPATPRVCVSVCSQRAPDLPGAIERAAELGDVIELRLDCLAGAELDVALSGLKNLLSSQTKPRIVTLRPVEQGGRREIDSLNRIVFWLDHLSKEGQPSELSDIELDAVRLLVEKEGLDWNRIICSHHDFSGNEADLEQLYQEMAKTPARVIKIAVLVNDAVDCIPLFRLLERAHAAHREIIVLAMGAAGMMTRILGPSRGSFLTYAALDKAHQTAPGQPTADELRHLYRIQKISAQTLITGIVGGTVAHSISPHMHNAAFEESGTDAVYIPFEVQDAGSFLRRMVSPRSREIEWRLRGLSVTAPHKTSVMSQLDWIDASAREIGAVNTIVVEDEELRGYNTDAAALLSTLVEKAVDLNGKRIAIIGAGGAARSALWSLTREGASVTLFARDVERASQLAEKFGARAERLEGAIFHDFEIVVNATPLGTRGVAEALTPATAKQLRGVSLAYDLVYNPEETRFLLEAQAAGCRILAGLEMLIAQAAEQFRLWTGRDAPIPAMRRAARKALESY